MKHLLALTLSLAAVFATACSSDENEKTIRFGDQVLTESEYTQYIKDNPEQCAEFIASTPEDRLFGLIALVAFGSVENEGDALHFMDLARNACR